MSVFEPQMFDDVPSVYEYTCDKCGAEINFGNAAEQVPLPLVEMCRERAIAAHRCTPPDDFG